MPRESLTEKRRRAGRILEALALAMPNAKIELNYQTPLQLLVAVLLSAQSTDKRVNVVTPSLFAAYPTALAFAQASTAQVEGYIKTVGLFRSKARHLIRLGAELEARFEGSVPIERARLAELPGVGAKTAGVVAMHLGGDPAFPVDTHVFRLAHRMGLSSRSTPDGTEADLQQIFPLARWFQGHQLLIWHGRRVCSAKKPACDRCPVAALCPNRGVAHRRSGQARKRR